MLTIKYTDVDGYERISEAYDIRAKHDGRQAIHLGWRDGRDVAHVLKHPTTAYVMNDAGATIGKYVVCGG